MNTVTAMPRHWLRTCEIAPKALLSSIGMIEIKGASKNYREQTIVAQHNRPQSQSPCGFRAILFTKSATESRRASPR